MTGLTIVAIPSQDDYVWRISSEKVPHMTILQLGDTYKVGRIFEYLEHVADMTMTRFDMDVDHRGTLGPQEADVLFFNKRHAKNLCDVRTYLLQSPDIRTAYDSVEQYEDWVPHLTMGYPETPAKEDTRDYSGISWVNFDKLALWVDDYDGPEIELKSNEWGEVRMSEDDDEFVDDLLTHHGVRGMKWGVRADKGHEGQRAKTKKIAKLDAKYERNASSVNTTLAIHNGAARYANDRLHTINNKPQYKNVDFNHESPIRTKYYAEHHALFLKGLHESAKSLGTNASGTKRYEVVDKGDRWDVVVSGVKHADNSNVEFTVKVNKDEKGHILLLEVMDMPQGSTPDAVDILQHFGVKGMRWGVRKSAEGHGGVSEDHTNAIAARVKAKHGGVKALSNKELQDLVTRMNLEQQYVKVVPPSKSAKFTRAGAKVVGDILLNVGKAQATKLATDHVTKLVAKGFKKP